MHFKTILAGCLALGSATTTRAADDGAELAKQLSNPISSLISVPFQSNWDFRMGALDDGWKYTMNFQPVVPLSLSEDWNVIVRTIVPFIAQEDVVGTSSQSGMGDIVQSFFFSPKAPTSGGIIWGVGPALLYPTATDNLLGGEKWAAGPTLVVLKQSGGWTYGALANHLWSYAGDDARADLSATFVQPFVSYTTKKATSFTLNTEATYDWNNGQWLVPVNLSVGQVVKFGKLPVQFTIGGKYYADGPSGAPEWGMRFVITPLFPKGAKPASAPDGKSYAK